MRLNLNYTDIKDFNFKLNRFIIVMLVHTV